LRPSLLWNVTHNAAYGGSPQWADELFSDCLTIEDGTDKLSRNVGA